MRSNDKFKEQDLIDNGIIGLGNAYSKPEDQTSEQIAMPCCCVGPQDDELLCPCQMYAAMMHFVYTEAKKLEIKYAMKTETENTQLLESAKIFQERALEAKQQTDFVNAKLVEAKNEIERWHDKDEGWSRTWVLRIGALEKILDKELSAASMTEYCRWLPIDKRTEGPVIHPPCSPANWLHEITARDYKHCPYCGRTIRIVEPEVEQ